jgi:uncharacterized protein YbaP (TraB family)
VIRGGLLLAAACLLTPAARAQTGDLPPVPENTQTITDVDPALWVLRDADTTVYLFGTVHVLRPGLGWFDDNVRAAFDKSDTLVLEMLDPSAAEAAAVMADLSIDKSGRTIRQKLGAEDLVAYEAAVAKLGLPHAALDPLDGWAVAVNLYYAGLLQKGYDMTSGVEVQLKAAAAASKKPMLGLETMRFQLSIFDSLPETVQVEYVTTTAKSIDEIAPQTDRLVELWATADTDGVAAVMNEGFDALKLTEPLLTRRNANWAAWINQRMAKPGTVFMAVGAGHLAGPVSVQHLLAAYGFNTEQVLD